MKSNSLYVVMTNESAGKAGENKIVIVNLRVKDEIREQFRIAAELKGSSMSGLLHQFIIKTIREEKEIDPSAFDALPKKKSSPVKVIKETGGADETVDEVPTMTFEELQEWRRERREKNKKSK